MIQQFWNSWCENFWYMMGTTEFILCKPKKGHIWKFNLAGLDSKAKTPVYETLQIIWSRLSGISDIKVRQLALATCKRNTVKETRLIRQVIPIRANDWGWDWPLAANRTHVISLRVRSFLPHPPDWEWPITITWTQVIPIRVKECLDECLLLPLWLWVASHNQLDTDDTNQGEWCLGVCPVSPSRL